MKYFIRQTGIAVLLSAMLAGCISDAVNGGRDTVVPVSGDDVTVTMTLQVPGANATRAAMSRQQEEFIDKIDVLVFDKDLKLVNWRTAQVEYDGTEPTFSTPLSASRSSDDLFRIMAVANMRELTYPLFSGANLGGHKGDTYTDVCALLADAVPSLTDLGVKCFPMWGELENSVLLDNPVHNYSMTLLRSLARIDVGTCASPAFAANGQITAWTALPNFSLEEVYVYNASTKFAVTPARAAYSFSGEKVSTFTIPSSNTKLTTPLLYSDSEQGAGTVARTSGLGTSLSGTIYAGESNVKMGGTYADNNHENRMALVVAGYYSPDPSTPNTTELSYYRIDFTVGDDGTTLMDVLRNNCYQMIILSVGGPGSETPEEAFETFNANLRVIINSWSDAGQAGTTIDGEYFLKVNPYDFTFDKWAKTAEEVAVTTNVPVAAGKSWSAAVVKYADADADPSWLTIVAGTASGVSGGVLKFNVAQVPDGSPESFTRSARLRFTAGKMNHDIIVTQTGADADFMLRLSASELLFPGRKWNAATSTWVQPDPQDITVKWGPKAHDYKLSLTDYTGGGVPMSVAIPAQSDLAVQTIKPQAISATDERVIADPFYERSSRLGFTAYDQTLGQTITKQVLIRQVFYSLIVSGTKDYYYQGKSYTFNIKSNSAWVATVAGTTDIFSSSPSVLSGSGNTKTGENMSFTIKSSATIDAKATITFSSPDNLFPSQTFTIIAQDIQPNCYIIASAGTTPAIPVSKAYRVWKYDRDLKTTLPATAITLELLWQDAVGLIPTTGIVVTGSGSTATFKVTAAAGKTGNAVVALKIGGVIYWTWHIWVTAQNPATNTAYQKSVNGYTFMDRHLGAQGTTAYAAYGLFYQGGRMVPFPPSAAETGATRRPIYNAAGTSLTYEDTGIVNVSAPATGGLPIALKNPMKFLYAPYGNTHWYGLLENDQRIDLWENGVYKSDYDPCPAGWMVASQPSLVGYHDGELTAAAYIWGGMNWPRQGYINYTGPISSVGDGAFLGSSRTNTTAYYQYKTSVEANGGVSRLCGGVPIRCIKEQ